MVVGCQPYAPAAFTPGIFLVLIFTRGWIDPRAMVLVGRKNPVTPLGIDPGTIRLVAQRFNQCATPGPSCNAMYPINMVCFGYMIIHTVHKGDNEDNNKNIKPKFTLEQSMKAQRVYRYISTLSLTSAIHEVCGERHVPAALSVGKWTGTHRTGWVGVRAFLGGCGKHCLHRDSIPGPSNP